MIFHQTPQARHTQVYFNKYPLFLEKVPITIGSPKWKKERKDRLPVNDFIYTSAFQHATEHHNFM